MKKLTARLFGATLCCLLTAACALQRPVASHAVAYNRAIAISHDQTLLLNIVRSMWRLPQQYTAVSEVRGQAALGLTPSIGVKLTEGKAGELTPGLTVARTTGASLVTVANLNNEEFIRAVSNPISIDQVDFFLTQGWPERLVGLLFIRRMEIVNDAWDLPPPVCRDKKTGKDLRGKEGPAGDGGAQTHIYKNEPQEWMDDPFALVRCFAARLLTLREDGGLKIVPGELRPVGPTFHHGQVENLPELVLQAAEAELTVAECRTCEQGAGAVVPCPGKGAPPCSQPPEQPSYQILKPGPKRVVWEEGTGPDKMREGYAASHESETLGDLPNGTASGLFHFRSPATVIYYLGEITRGQRKLLAKGRDELARLEPRICDRFESEEDAIERMRRELRAEGKVPPEKLTAGIDDRKCESSSLLFLAIESGDALAGDAKLAGEPLVTVKRGNKTWLIPNCSNPIPGDIDGCHRSMQTLTIVKQLIGLNKKRESLPTTGVVTVAGG